MNAKAKKSRQRVRVKQVKSGIGFTERQRADAARARPPQRIYQTVELEDTPAVRGMITAIAHLVRVEE